MPPSDRLHILVVEDDALVRADLCASLTELGYLVLGEAGCIDDARQALRDLAPDLVLLDIHLGQGQEGIELAHLINREAMIPFIYLTAHHDVATLRALRETLPAGFVLKPYDDNRLRAAIEIARHTYYAVLHPHWRQVEHLAQPLDLPEPLTPREQDLLQLLCRGYPNRRMAEELFVSVNTVKTHLKNLYLKLEVSNRAEAILRVKDGG